MSARTYWKLLVLLCVLCQGIIGTLSEKDIDESSELLVRRKRVINRTPGGDSKESIRNVPYVVAVKRHRDDEICIGVILTHVIVLTPAKCSVVRGRSTFKVYSGNSQAIVTHSHAQVHNVTDKRIFPFNYPFRAQDGIALLSVYPPFVYSINTRNILFYDGPVYPGLHGTVSGWGCHSVEDPGTAHPTYLRSITVPIISNQDCEMMYIHTFPITNSDLCTFDATGQQYCGVHDAGAPLVIEVNNQKYLLGIHLWNGGVIGRSNPDVFVNLQTPIYRNWIQQTIPVLEASVG